MSAAPGSKKSVTIMSRIHLSNPENRDIYVVVYLLKLKLPEDGNNRRLPSSGDDPYFYLLTPSWQSLYGSLNLRYRQFPQ